jgi:hypothetical protein
MYWPSIKHYLQYQYNKIYTEQTHGKMGKLGLLATTGRAQPQPLVGPLCAWPAWLDLQDCTGQSPV